MNLRDKLTRQQVEERMELYRDVFTTVRLLDVFDLRLAGEYERKENQRVVVKRRKVYIIRYCAAFVFLLK